jgi:glycosyltransferase involved in cell wall biosynthesis
MYDLAQWLSENRPDRVLVAGLRHEAYVALGVDEAFAARAVLLADDDDLAWQRGATFGNRIARRCQQAFTVVAASQPLADALVGGGYSNKQVTVIPRHVPLPPTRSPVARSHARAALSAVNADLVTAPGAAVALAVGRLDAAHRFGDLVRAWRIVTARRPDARLWIIGDGPDREPLYRQIGDLDQRFRVLIPGSFDCLDDLLQAVDLVIVPGYRLAPSLTLLTAQAAGLPVIASDAPGSALAIQNGATGVLYQLGDIPALAQNVLRLIEQPAYGVQLGAAARAVAQASAGRTEPCAFEHLFGNHIKR